MKQKLINAKNYYVRNERTILYTSLAVTPLLILGDRAGLNDHNRFLREHELYEEYYTLTDAE
jgi:hypothetical protein